MELNGIPKSFWHAASFSLIAFTIGFLFISYKSGELTIKFNQLEVKTTDTVALEANLSKQKEILDQQKITIDNRQAKVKELEELLNDRLEELQQVKIELAKLQESQDSTVVKAVESKIKSITNNEKFNESITSTRKELLSLQGLQQLQQQNLQQQQQMFDQQQQQQDQRSY